MALIHSLDLTCIEAPAGFNGIPSAESRLLEGSLLTNDFILAYRLHDPESFIH